ncbi:MAG: type I 3-dehydroquinate dehydratase [Anaerovoracaceae bacterium]
MKTFRVHDMEIGTGMPKICVPIIEDNHKSILKQADCIMRSPADIVEWRADFYRGNMGKYPLCKLLKQLHDRLPGKALLFTYRSVSEGGKGTAECREYAAICRRAVDTGFIDLIDVEYSMEWETVRHITSYAQQRGIRVISSLHNFNMTPPNQDLYKSFADMKKSGADVVKIAVMPQNPKDVLRLTSVALEASEMKASVPVVAVSMSGMGVSSRITGEIFNSAISFASVGRTSAPGQLEADSLDSMMIDIHRQLTDESYGKKSISGFLKDENIVLTGFMGTGKTRVSNVLSKACGRRVIDIDEAVERAEGMRISEIFEKKGEEYFRKCESEQTERISKMKNIIISCGGGTVMRKENVEALKSGGKIVMLRAKPETVYNRVKKSGNRRPLLAKYMSRGYISWLMKKREAVYMEVADHIINVDGCDSTSVAMELLEMLKRGERNLEIKDS